MYNVIGFLIFVCVPAVCVGMAVGLPLGAPVGLIVGLGMAGFSIDCFYNSKEDRR